MAKIFCPEKHNKWVTKNPLMIEIGENGLGKEYICCICRTKRVFNTANILTVNLLNKYGFIEGQKDNFFFHFSNLEGNFIPKKGMPVSFEVVFLGGGKHKFQAINIKPLQEMNNDR